MAADWNPLWDAIYYETFEHPTGGRTATLVSHPTAPYYVDFDADPGDELETKLQNAAKAYLDQLNALIADRAADDKKPYRKLLVPGEQNLVWLPIRPTEVERYSGLDHFLSRRLDRAGGQTYVLVAGQVLWDIDSPTYFLNSGVGSRVVVHVDDCGAARIASATAYSPPAGAQWFPWDDDADGVSIQLSIELLATAFEPATRMRMANLASINLSETPKYWRLRLGVDDRGPYLECGDTGLDKLRNGQIKTPYGAVFSVTTNGVELLSKFPLASHAASDTACTARIFDQDPSSSWPPDPSANRASRRPTRPEERLDDFRDAFHLRSPMPLETDDFSVRACPAFARADAELGRTTKQAPADPSLLKIRSDETSALAAYYGFAEIYEQMDSFGIDRGAYFSATEQQIHVHYRSGASRGPGRDGRTVNAEVLVSPQETGKPRIDVHLALASLTHKTMNPSAGPAAHADLYWPEHLGIANAERWLWHEMGHVLIAGCTGQPEPNFVHSVGDGLAAVWADPDSALAASRTTSGAKKDPRLWGLTFPWVELTRRHDRCVRNGWSWGGTFHRAVIDAPEDQLRGYKGYVSEQILSSTLFRLYRILGGDTVDAETGAPDHLTRREASRAVIYFVMRAVEMLTPLHVRAEELEIAMIEADIGLRTPLPLEISPPGAPRAERSEWIGGQAHKAIRWAFEAQGMHNPEDEIADKPGLPQAVDIYIPDRRPLEEAADGGVVRHDKGGYVPVSLDWDETPRWFSKGDRLWSSKVENRGVNPPSQEVSVRFWLGVARGDRKPAAWARGDNLSWFSWMAFAENDEARFKAWLDLQMDKNTGKWNPQTDRLLVVKEISAPKDRANTDPAAGLPCAIAHGGYPPSRPRDLASLIASDNNLGIWWLT